MKNKPYYIRLLFVLLLVPFSLTGCWSSKEIEDVSFTAGIALDRGRKSPPEEELQRKQGGYVKRNPIKVTYQIISPSAKNSGGGPQESYINISENGDSLHQVAREVALKRERPLFSAHLKSIVISDDLVRTYSLRDLVDHFLRDNELRLSSILFISKGKASASLESKEKGEIPAIRLAEISANRSKTARILPPVSLAKLEGKMQSGTSFLLQNVSTVNGEVKLAGAAVIKGRSKKMCGFLNEEDLEGIAWIKGRANGSVVKTLDKKAGRPMIYEVKSMRSNITPHVKKNNIFFDVNIESEGSLTEYGIGLKKSYKDQFIKRTEKAMEQEITRLMHDATEKMQKKFQVDVAGFGNRLRMEHPKIWKKVQKDWDRKFSGISIKYHVSATIQDYGASDLKQ
ncbi:spore gernimation protein GerC [Bacillus cereus]|uniref:Spore gernimation protein GerC n=1 Tax=Bacillus cereus TaxID=1396 RepID=A0A9X6YJY9_BACCE|nr:Ger(x)C family spore germination protein [Bacillus cereus]PEN84864.1 spore gernimation protein GerC [Bacillus cereus]